MNQGDIDQAKAALTGTSPIDGMSLEPDAHDTVAEETSPVTSEADQKQAGTTTV